jgi:23S rRNA (uridine2552-2'-O)-methyltransferase
MPGSYLPQDKFFKKAKEQGYRARSVFKLEELQNRFHLICPGDKVLDLGAAPGSFMQYIQKIIGKDGLLIGLDLTPIKPFSQPNVKAYVGDIFDDKVYDKIFKEHNVRRFDVVTSDLAPATSGIKFVDAGRSFDLNCQVLKVAEKYLKSGGNLVIKAFPGANHGQLIAKARALFEKVQMAKPEAVRNTSREEYLVGLRKRA